MNLLDKEIKVATMLAERATEITEWFRVKGFKSYKKKDKSPVTIADFGSQIYILNELKNQFPSDEIIAEEESEIDLDGEDLKVINKCFSELNIKISIKDYESILNYRGSKSKRQWTVDPIDGTKGFQKNLSYAVGIGLMLDSMPQLGVIAAPNYDNGKCAIFRAIKGSGSEFSYKNDNDFKKIKMRLEISLNDAILCHSLHYDEPWVMTLAKRAGISNFIQMDSMAKFCLIASGKADIYIKPLAKDRTYSWDFLPGILIVEEAGGIVSDLNGNPIKFQGEKCQITASGLIASNKQIHSSLLNVLKDEIFSHLLTI
ncbi:MAG: inositol monophosphatase family protein [Promethearchaeota archaeon]